MSVRMTTARPQVLNAAAGRLPPALLTRLAERYVLTDLPAAPLRAEFLAREGARFEAVITSAALGLDAATITALPALRVISSFGVGLDALDLHAAAARGIPVGYTPDVLNDCVADLAFGLLLDIARRLSEGDRYVRAGQWVAKPQVAFPLGRRVSGAKLGIVGLGRIGQTIAKRSQGFDMEVRYHNRRPVEGVAWRHEPSLLALAEWSDFLVLTVAASAGTRHLINADVLAALCPKGLLVNVARGSVVDEAALIACLQNGSLGGAALDVFDDEPHVPEALLALDQVVLTPHMASGTHETRQAMADLTLANLRAGLAAERLPARAP